MTNNETVAEKIVAHHRSMMEELDVLVDRVADAVRRGEPHQAAAKGVANYLAGTVFPHAEAEEKTLYAAAERRTDLAPLVEAMKAEHGLLRESLQHLVAAKDGIDAYGAARALGGLFRAHVLKENEHLLPVLVRDPDTDLSALLADMREHLAPHHSGASNDANGERSTEPAHGDDAGDDVELDVRALPHAQRHQTIFALVGRLPPGRALVIVNDHDPQPLRYQLNALFPGEFSWEYLEEGPDVWRVAIRKQHAG